MSAIPSCTLEGILPPWLEALALPGVGLSLPQLPSASMAWAFPSFVLCKFHRAFAFRDHVVEEKALPTFLSWTLWILKLVKFTSCSDA